MQHHSGKIIYISFFLFISFWINAYPQQQSLEGIYLNAGPGWSYYKVRDEGMSPLLYKGSAGLVNLALYDIRKKGRHLLHANFIYGKIKPSIYPDLSQSYANLMRIDIDYSYQRFVKSWHSGKTVLFIGLNWQTFQTVKKQAVYSNNAFNNTFVTSLGPSIMVLQRITGEKRNYLLTFQASVPVFALIQRPSFAFSIADGAYNNSYSYFNNFLKSLRPTTLNHYQRINTSLTLFYMLKNGNAIKLGYNWDLYNYMPFNHVISGSHELVVATVFKF